MSKFTDQIARLVDQAGNERKIPASQIAGQLAGSQVAPAASGSPGVVDLDDVATLSDATPAALGAADPGDNAAASRDDHVHPLPSASDVGAEPALGDPGSDGYVLSSTTGGARSWVAQSGGGGDPALGGDLDGTASTATVIGLQSYPLASDAPATDQVLTWDGSQWAPADVPGGGGGGAGRWRANRTPSGAVNGSNTVFTLPSSAVAGSVKPWLKPSGGSWGMLGPSDYSEDSTPANRCLGGTATANGTYSGSPAGAIDGNTGTFWGSNTTTHGWLAVDLGTAQDVIKSRLLANTSGGYSVPDAYDVQYSDDNSSWTTAATYGYPGSIAWDEQTFASVGSHRYWRCNITTTHGPYEPSIAEWELYIAPADATTAITLASAPASGGVVVVDYQEPA
jgi:hypothetical protein